MSGIVCLNDSILFLRTSYTPQLRVSLSTFLILSWNSPAFSSISWISSSSNLHHFHVSQFLSQFFLIPKFVLRAGTLSQLTKAQNRQGGQFWRYRVRTSSSLLCLWGLWSATCFRGLTPLLLSFHFVWGRVRAFSWKCFLCSSTVSLKSSTWPSTSCLSCFWDFESTCAPSASVSSNLFLCFVNHSQSVVLGFSKLMFLSLSFEILKLLLDRFDSCFEFR